MDNSNNIVSLFCSAAKQYPDTIAIVEQRRHICYSQLEEEVKNYATYLTAKGIKPGDRILIFIPMSINLYKTVLAVFYVGAIAVFLDEWVNKERMELCCRIAKCNAYIAPWKIRLLSVFSKELRAIPIKLKVSVRGEGFLLSLFPSGMEETALITFTTGSTGYPKAANRTHGFLRAQYSALEPLLPAQSKIDMTLLPIVLLLNLGKGKTSVIAEFNPRKPEKFDPNIIYLQLRNDNVESLTFSPYYLIETAKYLIKNNLQLHSLKNIISGGGPVFPEDAELIKMAFPMAKCTFVYGSTEAEPIAHTNISNFLETSGKIAAQKGLFVGKIDNSADVKIIPIVDGEINNFVPLLSGEVGEIIVSGKHVLTSYFNSDDAFRLNKISIDNTIWHRTGDAGWLNENKELFLMGRCKQIIYWENKFYYPFLIEQHLRFITGIYIGTLVLLNGQPFLIIQPDIEGLEEKIADEIKKSIYSEFKLLFMSNIPMDKRHNTKIDYDSLIQKIDMI